MLLPCIVGDGVGAAAGLYVGVFERGGVGAIDGVVTGAFEGLNVRGAGVPIYRIEHYGYIFDEEVNGEFNDYKEAEEYLFSVIKGAISKEVDWSKEVLNDISKWGEDQAERANAILKLVRESDYLEKI